MSSPTLVIGSPNLSSWSLRPWLVMRHFGLPFDEHVIDLDLPETPAEIRRYSPAGRVPVLRDGDLAVWESLAIIEYLAERHPEHAIWPRQPAGRARARSLAAEMHAGFPALRGELPVDVAGRHSDITVSDSARADIARILEIWRTALAATEEQPFLFGAFTAADAMFAPVVSRFVTYAIALDDITATYRDAVWSLPAMRDWHRKAGESIL